MHFSFLPPKACGTFRAEQAVNAERNSCYPKLVEIAGAVSHGAVSASYRGNLKARVIVQMLFGKDKNPCRLVYGVASLPLGTPVELEVIFEAAM